MNSFNYELCCKSCKTIRPRDAIFINTVNIIDHLSRDELIDELYEVYDLHCDKCGKKGDWVFLNVFLNENNKVRDRLKIDIIKENGQFFWNFENERQPSILINRSLIGIREKINTFKEEYVSHPKGNACIIIDILTDKPFINVSMFEVDGFSKDELNSVFGKIFNSPKIISHELKTKLENAFAGIKNDHTNPKIHAHLQNLVNNIDIYLMAKDPNEEVYYVILKEEFDSQGQIVRLPLYKIEEYGVEEIPLVEGE